MEKIIKIFYMRIGTFRCWLWGHNFVFESRELTDLAKELMRTGMKTIAFSEDYMKIIKRSPFCIRCGIDRKDTE